MAGCVPITGIEGCDKCAGERQAGPFEASVCRSQFAGQISLLPMEGDKSLRRYRGNEEEWECPRRNLGVGRGQDRNHRHVHGYRGKDKRADDSNRVQERTVAAKAMSCRCEERVGGFSDERRDYRRNCYSDYSVAEGRRGRRSSKPCQGTSDRPRAGIDEELQVWRAGVTEKRRGANDEGRKTPQRYRRQDDGYKRDRTLGRSAKSDPPTL